MKRAESELIAEVAARVALENPDDETLATTALMADKIAKSDRRRQTSPENGKAGGRPPTGRKRLVVYVTPTERELIFNSVPRLKERACASSVSRNAALLSCK